MNTAMTIRTQLTKTIDELPVEVLPELVNFVESLRFKIHYQPAKTSTGSAFLLSIAGLGSSEETDISERDEAILAKEIDPLHGWTLRRGESP